VLSGLIGILCPPCLWTVGGFSFLFLGVSGRLNAWNYHSLSVIANFFILVYTGDIVCIFSDYGERLLSDAWRRSGCVGG
ncbi:MAG: hypothetical protein WAU31_01460, partial [Candidatus Moraniibacteriota bacterium]